MDARPRKYVDYLASSPRGDVATRPGPLAVLRAQLREAGLAERVVAVAAHVDPSTGQVDEYTLQVLAPLSEYQQVQLVELIRPAAFTLDMRRLTHPPR